ncbi:hypothetical protein ACRCUN_29375 [Mycobacterium sp. LTG2003]
MNRRMRPAAVALTAALLCACAPTVPGEAVPEPPPHPAPPPGVFPDFDLLTPADTASYTSTNWHHDTIVRFKGPGDVSCLSSVYGQTTGADGLGMIECSGRSMPGFPDNASGQDIRRDASSWETIVQSVHQVSSAGFVFTYAHGGDAAETGDVRELPAGHKLVVNNSGCGVGDDFIACFTAYDDGFVISPKGSWAF